MDPGIKLLITIILPFMVLVGLIYTGGYYMRDITMSSEYEYEVSIETDANISNVNITVPFPSELADGSFSRPEGWTTHIYEDENNLSIAADNISADSSSSLSLTMKKGEEIKTWDPLENEPMLDPEANFTEVECDPSSDVEAEKCYNYDYTRTIAVSYEGSNETQIEISIELTGTNQWWLLDNLESQYSDKLTVDLDKEGRYVPEGQVKTGIGD